MPERPFVPVQFYMQAAPGLEEAIERLTAALAAIRADLDRLWEAIPQTVPPVGHIERMWDNDNDEWRWNSATGLWHMGSFDGTGELLSDVEKRWGPTTTERPANPGITFNEDKS